MDHEPREGAPETAMTRLYVVRHGRTAHNVAKRIQGPTIDDPLDDVGRAQAEALARRFAALRDEGEPFAALYASPLRRAIETAEPLSRELGLPVEPLAGVLEFSWGVYDGRVEEDDVSRAVSEALARWTGGDVHHAPPGGDSPIDAAARAAEAVDRVTTLHAGRSVIVVGHGRINRILLAHLAYGDLRRMEEFVQSNTGVTLIEQRARAARPWERAARPWDSARGSWETARRIQGDGDGPSRPTAPRSPPNGPLRPLRDIQREPDKAEPGEAEPHQAEPHQAEPHQAEPDQAEPDQAERESPSGAGNLPADGEEIVPRTAAPGAGEWTVIFANSRAHLEDPLAGGAPPHASDAARMHRHGHEPAREESRAARHGREQ